MAPPRPALAQSESKARFFERLGLDERNEFHRRVYAMMKVCVGVGVYVRVLFGHSVLGRCC